MSTNFSESSGFVEETSEFCPNVNSDPLGLLSCETLPCVCNCGSITCSEWIWWGSGLVLVVVIVPATAGWCEWVVGGIWCDCWGWLGEDMACCRGDGVGWGERTVCGNVDIASLALTFSKVCKHINACKNGLISFVPTNSMEKVVEHEYYKYQSFSER